MVSFSKASSTLFYASVIGAHVVSGHKAIKGEDNVKFAAELKKLRASQKKGKGASGDDPAPAAADTAGDGNAGPGGDEIGTFLINHEFIAPGPTDQRGPCPFINVLANHGFINRNGQGINVFVIPELATVVADLPSLGFVVPANLAIFDGQAKIMDDGEAKLDITRLFLRPGEERDISMVFPNAGLAWTEENLNRPASEGFEEGNVATFNAFRSTISEALLQQLLAKEEDGYLTQDDHSEFLTERIDDSFAEDKFFELSEDSFGVAAGQYILPCLIVGTDLGPFERDVDPALRPVQKCMADDIESWWREFRLPDGYAPRSIRFGSEFDPVFYQEVRQGIQDHNFELVEEHFLEGVLEAAGRLPPTSVRGRSTK